MDNKKITEDLKMKARFFQFVLVLAIFSSGYVCAQGGITAVPFLQAPASAEMFGMGYASAAVRSNDPMISFYNPAQSGMQSFNTNIAVGYNSSDWLSKSFPGLKVTSFAFNGGVDISKFIDKIPPICIGFGYSQLKFDFGRFFVTDPFSSDIRTSFDSYDKADNFTLSAAVDYYIKASFGLTYRHVYSNLGSSLFSSTKPVDLTATANLYDWGIFIDVPVFPILEKALEKPLKTGSNISPVFDLSFGFSNSNLGQNSISYTNQFSQQSDPLPRMARTGIGFLAGVQYDINNVHFMPISAKWTIEANDLLIKEKQSVNGWSWEYQSGMGDINFFKEVIAGKTNKQTEKLKGWELNLLETASLFGGRFEEENTMGGRRFNSSGWSIRSAGLFKVLRLVNPDLFGKNVLSYVLNHLDFRYTTSKLKTDSPSSPLNNVEFSTFNVIFYSL